MSIETKTVVIFSAGIVFGLSILGYSEAINLKPLFSPQLPWWVFASFAIISFGIAGIIGSSISQEQ